MSVCMYLYLIAYYFFNLIYPPTPQSALISVCARVFGLLLVIFVQVLFLNNFLSFSFSFCFWREFVWFLIIQVYVGYNQPHIINMFSFVNNTDINCAANVIYWALLAAHIAYASLPSFLVPVNSRYAYLVMLCVVGSKWVLEPKEIYKLNRIKHGE